MSIIQANLAAGWNAFLDTEPPLQLVIVAAVVVCALWWFIAWHLSKEDRRLMFTEGRRDDRPWILDPDVRLRMRRDLEIAARRKPYPELRRKPSGPDKAA